MNILYLLGCLFVEKQRYFLRVLIAGLGGIGGPYRLDAGHQVYQVPQHEKDAVPDHVREAGRDMARKAFKERIYEINMSESDSNVYEEFSNSVRKQV